MASIRMDDTPAGLPLGPNRLPFDHPLDVLRESDGPPNIVRLFLRWQDEPRSVADCAGLLVRTIEQSGVIAESGVILAPAGFVSSWLDEPTRARYPDEDEATAIRAAAVAATANLSRLLPAVRPTLIFGVDVFACCNRSSGNRGVGQFAAVLPNTSAEAVLFPKRYPTPEEEAFLRVADPTSNPPAPVIDSPVGRVVVLVCHDISVYHPRGRATTSSDYRAGWQTLLCDQIADGTPALGVNLIHYVDSVRTFSQPYNVWTNEVGVPLFGVSQISSVVERNTAAELADSLTLNPQYWPVLDLCEPPLEAAE